MPLSYTAIFHLELFLTLLLFLVFIVIYLCVNSTRDPTVLGHYIGYLILCIIIFLIFPCLAMFTPCQPLCKHRYGVYPCIMLAGPHLRSKPLFVFVFTPTCPILVRRGLHLRPTAFIVLVTSGRLPDWRHTLSARSLIGCRTLAPLSSVIVRGE